MADRSTRIMIMSSCYILFLAFIGLIAFGEKYNAMVILDTRAEAEKGVGDILIVLAAKLRNYVVLQSVYLSTAIGVPLNEADLIEKVYKRLFGFLVIMMVIVGRMSIKKYSKGMRMRDLERRERMRERKREREHEALSDEQRKEVAALKSIAKLVSVKDVRDSKKDQ